MTPTSRPEIPARPESLLDKSRRELLVRRAKVAWFQARRLASWTADPRSWRQPEVAPSRRGFGRRIYRHEIALRRRDPGVDPVLDAGKRVNVALAAPHLDGLVLRPDRPLSFWRAVGRCTAARGFQRGMEVRGGCIVPTLGGGICVLSNALFRMACQLGWIILERHGHTVEAAPDPHSDDSSTVWGMDATLFWPHVDLRFAPRSGAARLTVEVRGEVLILAVDVPEAGDRDGLIGHDPFDPDAVDVLFESDGDVTETIGGARVRQNRVIRRIVCRRTGRVLAREVVAENRRRLLHSAEQRRNCLSCGESACRARPRGLGRHLGRSTAARGDAGELIRLTTARPGPRTT